jgi:hypothetical protein
MTRIKVPGTLLPERAAGLRCQALSCRNELLGRFQALSAAKVPGTFGSTVGCRRKVPGTFGGALLVLDPRCPETLHECNARKRSSP